MTSERRDSPAAATGSVWSDDARRALDGLRATCALIRKAENEPTRWPVDSWNDDLLSPRAWMLQMASVRFHFARFYLGLAKEAARAY